MPRFRPRFAVFKSPTSDWVIMNTQSMVLAAASGSWYLCVVSAMIEMT